MLKYVGQGTSWPGVPARDLTEEEVEQYGGERVLLAVGLWEKPKLPKPAKKDEPDEQ